MLLNGAYLVADADLERFRERVDLLDAEFGRLGAAVELTGSAATSCGCLSSRSPR